MTVTALDIAIKTGLALSNGESGVRDFSAFALDEPRLFHEFHRWLSRGLKDWKTETLVIEAPFLAKRPGILALIGLNAIARMAAHENGLRPISVAPATWRKSVLGIGNLKRKDAKRRALNHVGPAVTDDNQAEAICILEWYMHRKDVPVGLIKSRHREFTLPEAV